jgi:hypothetical protein
MTSIYALIDPITHRVRYVGQSRNPELRRLQHVSRARFDNQAVHQWIRGLGELPGLVILEAVENRRIRTGTCSVSLASVMEAKWLKRFRRTVLNYDKRQCAAYDLFVNSPEVLEKIYSKEQ